MVSVPAAAPALVVMPEQVYHLTPSVSSEERLRPLLLPAHLPATVLLQALQFVKRFGESGLAAVALTVMAEARLSRQPGQL
jgi:hypothetical protein